MLAGLPRPEELFPGSQFPMIEPLAPSPDPQDELQWLLQGCLDGRAESVRALGMTFAPLVYRIALCLLEDKSAAKALTPRALLAAVQRLDHYKWTPRFPVWLARWTVKTCRAEHGRGILTPQRGARLGVLLASVARFSVEEIACALGVSATRVSAWQRAHPPETPAESAEEEPFSEAELERLAGGLPPRLEAWHRSRQRRLTLSSLAWVSAAVSLVLGAGWLYSGRVSLPEPTSVVVRITVEATFQPTIQVTPQAIGIFLPTATSTEFPVKAKIYRVQSRLTLGELAEQLNIPVVILSALNNLPSQTVLKPGTRLRIGRSYNSPVMITPTPVTPAAQSPPMDAGASSDEVRKRLLDSRTRWHTLWADSLAVNYGPPGYVGPPEVQRAQVWISQPSFSLVLSGPPAGPPDHSWVTVDTQVYDRDLVRDRISSYTTGGSLPFTVVTALFSPSRWFGVSPQPSLVVVGEETVIGRSGLVVDLLDEVPPGPGLNERMRTARLWVDAQTGILLRYQAYDPHSQALLEEVTLTALALDVNLSNRLFEPYGPPFAAFAEDHRGRPPAETAAQPTLTITLPPERNPPPRTLPPPGFDPARGQLSVHLTTLGDLQRGPFAYSLFADGFFLGDVEVGYTYWDLCERSADGRRLAYKYVQPPRDEEPDWEHIPQLRWIDLDAPGQVHLPLPWLTVLEFAFAPDSRHLAVYGCDEGVDTCGLYVLDLDRDQLELVVPVYGGWDLIWSPQGESLALAGGLKPNEQANLLVIRLEDGQIIYSTPIRWGSGDSPPYPPDAPVAEWGVPFPPVRSAWRDGCSS